MQIFKSHKHGSVLLISGGGWWGRDMSERILGYLLVNYSSAKNVGCWLLWPEIPAGSALLLVILPRKPMPTGFMNAFSNCERVLLGKTLINCITLVGKIKCKLDN